MDGWHHTLDWLRDVSIQFVLVFGAALAYFGVRGLTEGSETIAVSNARRVLGFEDNLGIDIERSLQGLILHNDVLVTAANWMYIWGHGPVIGLTLFWLYRSDRVSYTSLRNAMFISGAIGLVIFMSFPVAPPRLMPSGFVDTVTELSTSYHVLQPPSLVNKYAAVPSLHVGWNLLVGVFIFARMHSVVGDRRTDHGEIASRDENRALHEVEIERLVDAVVDDPAIEKQVGDRPVPVASRPL